MRTTDLPTAPSLDASLLDPYEVQRLRERHRAQVNRPWWLVVVAGAAALCLYLYTLLQAARRVPVSDEAVANPVTTGVAVALAAAAIAIVRTERGRWPAALALGGLALAWSQLLAAPDLVETLRSPIDVAFLFSLAVLTITAASALARHRPPPPPV